MRFRLGLLLGIAIVVLSAWPVALAGAGSSITLDGSFSTAIVKPSNVNGYCPLPGVVGDECGTIQLIGLGAAVWVYTFGPTFEPDGRCYDVDGTLTLTLQSDGSTVSGPLTGLYCPRQSINVPPHYSFGNPFFEDDTVAFADGTGQFNGLSGTAVFHTFFAGAAIKGTLQGTLSG